jgi:DNA helicase-2/ATP-dependent DNA helicase PcrA
MATDVARLLQRLNPEQRAAVVAPPGPLKVYAGAGTGKTAVLSHRIAYAIADARCEPSRILAVTFTNKAALELSIRIDGLLGDDHGENGVWKGTFHRFGARMLRSFGQHLGLPTPKTAGRTPTIWDEDDQRVALDAALAHTGVQPEDLLEQVPEQGGQSAAVIRMRALIDRAKAEMRGPADMEPSSDPEAAAQRVYAAYEALKLRSGAVDFGDLLVLPNVIMETVPEVRERMSERFTMVLVDEYQDTNPAQYGLTRKLSESHRNITVVGDSLQAIFGWRGADVRNIEMFESDYPDATVVRLEHNYRSTQVVLDAANGLIRNNPDRATLHLWSERGGGDPISIVRAADEFDEARAIADEVHRLIDTQRYSAADVAILYRVNAQSAALEKILRGSGLPYLVVGGLRFFDRREVRDALAYLRCVHNPADVAAFARAATMPKRGIGEVTLDLLMAAAAQPLAEHRSRTIFDIVRDPEVRARIRKQTLGPLDAFVEILQRFAESATTAAVADTIDGLLRESGYYAVLQSSGSAEDVARLENLLELVTYAREFGDAPGSQGVSSLLEEASLESPDDDVEDVPALTLSTLHQAKGREWAVVFLTGLEDGMLPYRRTVRERADGICEERRLAYVGMTRAKDVLYLCYAQRRQLYEMAFNTQATPSMFLDEVPPELCVDLPTAEVLDLEAGTLGR